MGATTVEIHSSHVPMVSHPAEVAQLIKTAADAVRTASQTGSAWLDSLDVSEVGTTAVTAAELRYGVTRLPDGHRKRELAAVIHGILTEDFHGRVFPFDERASIRYADVVTGRERNSRPIGVADAQITAICHDLGAILATRNTADFEETGVELLNPWKLG